MSGIKTDRFGINLAIALTVLSCLIIALFWQKLPPQVPFFYSRPWGEEQLAKPLFLLLLPLSSTLFLFANFLIPKFLKADELFQKILIWSTVLFSFLAFFILVRIISLII